MDMRFYWIQDQIKRDRFYVFWKRTMANLGDYLTKHNPSHHQT